MGQLAKSGRGTERRREARDDCYLPIWLYPDGFGGESFSLPARNITLEGVFVESTILFDVGELFEVEYYAPGADTPIRARAQVARVNASRRKGVPGMALKLVSYSGSSH
jgi:hypothetical protein